MKRYSLLLAALLFGTSYSTLQAQDYPPNAEPGKCYAKCMIPDKYIDVTEEVLIKQATQRLEITPAKFETQEARIEVESATNRLEVIPAVFKTVEEKIEVKPASVRLEPVPARYETIEEEVMVRPEEIQFEKIPAQYETITEQIEVSPPRTKWIRRKGDSNCLSQDPNDCLVWCLVEVPAKYKTYTKTVLKGCPYN